MAKKSPKKTSKAGRKVTRYVVYAVGIKSGKPLEHKVLKSAAIALSYASLWDSMSKRRAFVSTHRMELSPKGEYKFIGKPSQAFQ